MVPSAPVPPVSNFVLDQQVCFALHAASRAMTGCYRPLLEHLGLTYSQYAVMLVLWEHESITLGELCARLYLDTGTLSPLLKRMDGLGLLTRHRRVEDERTVQVILTPDGRALHDRAAAAQARVQEATGLSPTELAVLRDQLNALTGRLRATHLVPDIA